MNHFLKSKLPWMSLPGLALVILVIVFLLRPVAPDYKISSRDAVRLIIDQSALVSVKETGGKQLIDIRPAELYLHGHAEGAVSIPVRQLLDDQTVELLNDFLKSSKVVVLYGSNQLQATAPFFLLQQLGYKNIRVLKGGFNSANEFYETGAVSSEVPILDTTALHANKEMRFNTLSPVSNQKKESVIPVRKGVSAGGGC